MPLQYRLFGAKRYYLEAVRKTKTEATSLARRLRQEGFLARVKKLPATARFMNSEGRWAVYLRHERQGRG